MRLSDLKIQREGWGRARVSCSVDGRELWYEVESDVDVEPSGRLDFALPPLLRRCMEVGEDLVAEGAVSSRLLWQLRHVVAPLALQSNPRLRPARIEARELVDERRTGQGHVVMAMSCGLDSLASLRELLDAPRGLRPTAFLHHGIAGRPPGPVGDRSFQQDLAKVRRLGEEIGLPTIAVRGNLEELTPGKHLPRQTFRSASLPLLLQPTIERWHYGTSWPWTGHDDGGCGRWEQVFWEACSTGETECRSAGVRWTRAAKAAFVADWPIAHRYLSICMRHGRRGAGRNCGGGCEKCRRTCLAFHMLGALDRFAAIVDVAAFERSRPAYEREVLASENVFCADLRAFADEVGYRLGG